MNWTDERTEALKKLWADGLSASQIASRLGGFAHCADGGRSAVIGKVHRLDLAGRDTISRSKNPFKSRGGTKGVRRARNSFVAGNPAVRALFKAEPFAAAPDIEIPLADRKTLDQLEEASCRWPYGDPRQVGFYFCGRPKVPGLSYCCDHARRAYQPPQTRRQAAAAEPIVVREAESV